jgi:hypothetical protein
MTGVHEALRDLRTTAGHEDITTGQAPAARQLARLRRPIGVASAILDIEAPRERDACVGNYRTPPLWFPDMNFPAGVQSDGGAVWPVCR